ncbi:ElyC/SanA/YdcF family protein [Virgisporangium aurantiacum]|uniref:DUF218 domain-containing protein n=1 Tax=Virgisporangium aurantiacum TaxID=175570 RepID=A0A8J4DYB4_9ACTN|nr:ElyC/SanA/YdcF family protein [Virgisporangium aurantiacum]GIJ54461.1 hypothetical protein Vau01_019770 [Virgisporangium aurantiacum]
MHADTLLVFGRGVTVVDGRYRLTPESLARVRAAVNHVEHGRPERIVFTGGWALADGPTGPPVGSREGDLMLAAARAAGVAPEVELLAETRSRSTLENLLHTVEERLLGERAFTSARPLGIVSHGWHLPRVRYLIGKILRLRGAALLDVPVAGGNVPLSERMLAVGSRLCFLGCADPATLRRRERLVTRLSKRA